MIELWCLVTWSDETGMNVTDSVRGESWYGTKSEAVAKMGNWQVTRSAVNVISLCRAKFTQRPKPQLWVDGMNGALSYDTMKIVKTWRRK